MSSAELEAEELPTRKKRGRPRKNPNEGKQSLHTKDTRRPLSDSVIADALVAAGAVLEPLAKERLWYEPPASLGAIRKLLCALPDSERWRVSVFIELDEAHRITRERSF